MSRDIAELDREAQADTAAGAPREPYPVVLHAEPFSSRVALLQGLYGQSVASLVKQATLPAEYAPYLRVWLNDEEVPSDRWLSTIPEIGQQVYIRVVPQKSGKDITRAILMVAITVVAVAAAPYLAGALLPAGAGAFATSAATGLIAAGISTAGMLALNALIPPPGLRNNAQDEKARLTGSSNTFAPYGNIPRVFGKRRVYPMLAARPYSEIQGNDEYLRMALVVGWGPLEITNIRIGETPITAFDGVEIEIREGWASDAPLALFTRTVTEDTFTLRLEPQATTDYYGGGYGYYGDHYAFDANINTYGAVNPSTVATTNDYGMRTTAINAVEFSVDIAFPQGLFRFDDKGNQKEATVEFSVQYAPVGSTSWVNAVWANSTETGFGTAGKITVKGASSTAMRRSGRVVLPSAGQYNVRVRRNTANSGAKYVDLAWWTALRTIKADYPVNQPNVALLALRIKASGQLNGVPQTINCDAESYLPVRNASTGVWAYAKTANPAWAFADILRRRGGVEFIPDARIDLPAIQAWAAACEATAPNASEPRWTFDAVLEGGSIIDSLKLIGGNSRALYTMRDGKHSVVRDTLQTVPVQHITPRNSFGYSGSKVFLEYPHAFRVLFINKLNGYQQDERIVYADGYTAANATKFETLEMVGCTSPTQAFREARYHMAVARLRPEQHVVQMDVEALRCTLGDLVLFSHDAIGIGIMASRVRALTLTSGNVVSVTLDDDVYFETGKTYALRTRKSDGASRFQTVVNPGTGYAATLTFTSPTSEANSPAVGDLVVFGESMTVTAPMLVRKIDPSENFNVTVTLVDAQDGVYTADTGLIPPFNSYLGSGSALGSGTVPKVYISTVRSDDSVVLVNADGSLTYRIYVGVQQPESTGDERIASFEVQHRIKGTDVWTTLPLPRDNPFGYVDRVLVGDIYELRARGLAESGAAGVWSDVVEHTVVGKTNFSGVPINVVAAGIAGGVRLTWTNPTNNDLWETKVYENTVNVAGTATLLATVTATQYLRLGLSTSDGLRYYWLQAVDTSGNAGALSAGVSATALGKGLVVTLSNEAVSLAADADGVVSSYATAEGRMTVFDGDTDVMASVTLSAVGTSCTGTINTVANTPVNGQPKGYYRVTAASADNALLTLTVTYGGQTLVKLFTVAKSRAGTIGNDAVSLVLSKTAAQVFGYADGTVPSYAEAEGVLKVYRGATDVTSLATLSATAVGVTGTINTATNTPVSGQPKGFYRVTNISGDTGSLALTATISGASYSATFSVAKTKGGYEIVSALPTTNLFIGRVVFLSTDGKLYRYTATGWTAAVPAGDITGQLVGSQVADGAINTAKFAASLEPVTLVSSVPVTKSTSTIFNTTDGKLYRWNGSAYVATVLSGDIAGQLSSTQIAALEASKITGQLTDAQLAAIAAAKIAGQLTDAQIASVSIIKVSGGTGGGNLLSNSNFKNVTGTLNADGSLPAGWSVYNNASISNTTRVVSGGLFGTNYYRITANAATSAQLGIYTQGGAGIWTPAVTYIISFWARAASANVVGRFMEGLYSNMGFSAATVVANPPLVQNTWQRYVWRVQPASNANTPTGELFLSWYVDGTFPSGGVMEICAVQVEQGELVSAYAPRPDEILPGTIGTTEIANDAVTTAKLIAGAVTANRIAAGAVETDKLAANAVTAIKIAANAVEADKIAANAVTAGKINAGAVTAGTIAAGAVTAGTIAVDAVTAGTIAAGAVTTAKIAAGAVTAGTIAAGAITTVKLAAGAVTANEIAANTITSAQIAADAITAGQIAAGAITTSELAANAVTAAKIAAGTITANEIAANTITAAKIAAGTITAAEIAANAIIADKIDAGAITAAKLAVNAVTANAINADAITTNKIAAGAVTADKIVASAITADKIAAGAVTADKLTTGTLITSSAQIGTGVIASANIGSLNVEKLSGDITRYVNTYSTPVGYLSTSWTTYITMALPASTAASGHQPYLQVNIQNASYVISMVYVALYSAPIGNGVTVPDLYLGYPSIDGYWNEYDWETSVYTQYGWELYWLGEIDVQVGDTIQSATFNTGIVESASFDGTYTRLLIATAAGLNAPYTRIRPSLANGQVGTYTEIATTLFDANDMIGVTMFVPETGTTLGRSFQVRLRAQIANRVLVRRIDALAMGIR